MSLRQCIMAWSRLALLAGLALVAGVVRPTEPQVARATDIAAPRATVSAMRRLTEAQYRSMIADVFGADIKVTGRFEPEIRMQGMLAASARTAGLTATTIENYEAMARIVAAQVIDPEHRARLVGCEPGPGDPVGRACAIAFFDRVGLRLYRRPLQPDERQLLVSSSLAAASRLGSFHQGLAAALTAALIDLPVLFQVDHYVADPARPGSRTLDGWSRAARLSFLLWNTAPDEALLAAARSGALMSDAGLAAQVDRLLASPRFRDSGRAFFDDFLQLDGLASLSKDALLYPAFRAGVPAAAREQTLRTIVQLLYVEQGDYRTIFTTRRVAMNRTLSPLYRLPFPGHDWAMVDLPADDAHAGLMSQVGFLALHSHPGRTSPTLRGKAIREILLCEEVPTPPANVNFAIVQDTTNPQFKTTRERLSAHLDDEECASCHKRTDGIGLTFERFDGAGQYRTNENGEAIDTSGVFDKAPVADPVELGRAVGQSAKAAQCLVRSAYRFAAGRPLEATDQPFLARRDADFAASGYRIAPLFRAIVLDRDFFADPNGAVAGGPGRLARRR